MLHKIPSVQSPSSNSFKHSHLKMCKSVIQELDSINLMGAKKREACVRVSDGVKLQEVILAAISSDLELGSKPDDSTGSLCLGNRSLDVLHVAFEFHGPLIQVTRGDLQQPHLRSSLK